MVHSKGNEKGRNEQKNSDLEGSISMVPEKNYTSGLTDFKMVLNGELFPSIITVSCFLLIQPNKPLKLPERRQWKTWEPDMRLCFPSGENFL